MSCDKHIGSGERSGVMKAVLGNYVQQQQSADGTGKGEDERQRNQPGDCQQPGQGPGSGGIENEEAEVTVRYIPKQKQNLER